MGRVVALEFHVDGVLERILVGFEDNRVGLGEFARRGDIEESVLERRGNPIDDIGQKSVWKMLGETGSIKDGRRTIVRELLGAVRAQRKHGKFDIDDSRTRLEVRGI